MKEDKLDTAEHLDHGPNDYNPYDNVRHAQVLVSVPLDTESSLKRLLQCEEKPRGEVWNHARSLLMTYVGQQTVEGGNVQTPADQREVLGPTNPTARAIHLSAVVKACEQAIIELANDVDLSVRAMNELGDVLLSTSIK